MYGPQLIEMAQVAEQEHMRNAIMARTRAQQRHEQRASCVDRGGSLGRGPPSGLLATSCSSARASTGDGRPADLTPCTDC